MLNTEQKKEHAMREDRQIQKLEALVAELEAELAQKRAINARIAAELLEYCMDAGR